MNRKILALSLGGIAGGVFNMGQVKGGGKNKRPLGPPFGAVDRHNAKPLWGRVLNPLLYDARWLADVPGSYRLPSQRVPKPPASLSPSPGIHS